MVAFVLSLLSSLFEAQFIGEQFVRFMKESYRQKLATYNKAGRGLSTGACG